MTLDLAPARRPRLTLGGGLLALGLLLGTAACGSDGEGDAAGSGAAASGATTGPSAAADPTSSGAASDTAAAEPSGDDGAATATCVKDSDYLSGTSTVIWTPDAKSEHQLSEVSADNEFALTADGKLDPATIEVAVGEVFSVTLAKDSPGISVLTIGCDGGQTLPKGTPAGVYITAPGTYAVTSGIENTPAGTIVVQ